MSNIIKCNSAEDNRFKSISDFKDCVNRGGEVEFDWGDKTFGIFPKLKKTPDSPLQMLITQVCVENMRSTEKWCDTAEEVLEYMIDGVRLYDIITKVYVWDRTI